MSNELALVREETGEIVGVVGEIQAHSDQWLSCTGKEVYERKPEDRDQPRHAVTPLADDSPLREIITIGKSVLDTIGKSREVIAMTLLPGHNIRLVVADKPIPPADTMESVLRELRTTVLDYEYLLHFAPKIDAVLKEKE